MTRQEFESRKWLHDTHLHIPSLWVSDMMGELRHRTIWAKLVKIDGDYIVCELDDIIKGIRCFHYQQL